MTQLGSIEEPTAWPYSMQIPGFVDLQVNGFSGIDFSSAELTSASFTKACRNVFREGTAAFLPTVVTSELDVYQRNLSLMARVLRQEEFRGRLLGLHLEGPFISPKPGAVGAHNPAWTQAGDLTLLAKLQDWADGSIRLLTVAAEVEGVEELSRLAVQMGITVSLGHQMALEEDLARLAGAGAKALTHLGNGIPGILPRHPNPLWAGLAEDRLTAMIITDGHHLPVSVIKVVLMTKGVERTIVVSDASPIAGLPPGTYRTLNNLAVLEESGRLHNPEKGVLVGSSATMLRCMNHLRSLGLIGFEQLLKVGYENPLRLIGAAFEDLDPEPLISFLPDKGFVSIPKS